MNRPIAPRHACPGGCGAQVPHRLVACASCWWLLPQPLRQAIMRPGARSRLAGVAEALTWYRTYREENGL